MARSNNILLSIVLPIIVFVPLSYTAYKLLFGHLEKAGLLKLDANCPIPYQGASPFQLQYLGGYAPGVEHTLCILVGFFHPLFQSEALPDTPFVTDFLASFTACVVIPFFEASRGNRPLLLNFPVLMGVVYQMFTGAVAFPIFWTALLVFTRDNAAGSQISQAGAEASLFGLVVGYVLPSFAMSYLASPGPIALWQAFPVIISIFHNIHLLVRPARSHNSSGYRTVQTTYILIFLVSTFVHLRTLAAYNFDPQTILNGLIPTLEIPDAKKGHTGLTSAVHFLKWDSLIIFSSTFLASLWFAESVAQGIQILTWIVTSTALLGPGAAVSGIFLWRESRLNQARLKQSAKHGKAL